MSRGAARWVLRRIALGQSNHWAVQLIRYTWVGLVATAADTWLFALLAARLEVHYLPASAAGIILGNTLNYLLSRHYVFPARRHGAGKEIMLYAAVGAVGLLLTWLMLWLLIDLASLAPIPAKLLSLILVFFWSFLGRKYLVFSNLDAGAARLPVERSAAAGGPDGGDRT